MAQKRPERRSRFAPKADVRELPWMTPPQAGRKPALQGQCCASAARPKAKLAAARVPPRDHMPCGAGSGNSRHSTCMCPMTATAGSCDRLVLRQKMRARAPSPISRQPRFRAPWRRLAALAMAFPWIKLPPPVWRPNADWPLQRYRLNLWCLPAAGPSPDAVRTTMQAWAKAI